MTNQNFKIGDRISYQIAGMTTPEYGTVSSLARVPGRMFVTFDGDTRGKLTPMDACQHGEHASWWRQDADGKWHSTRTALLAIIQQATQRLDAGEPFNTTAAELGLTPSELKEILK